MSRQDGAHEDPEDDGRQNREINQNQKSERQQQPKAAHVASVSCDRGRWPRGTTPVEDQRPDGRVVLRTDVSVRAEEFEQRFGVLPTDGEG